MKRFLMMCAALLVSGGVAFGYTNVLENATTQVVSSVWSLPGTHIWVGNLTTNNALVVVAGGSVLNENSFIGATAGASNNTAAVSSGASWISTGTLQVGAAGNLSNTVSVSDSGIIVASNLVVSAGNDFNLSDNGVLVMTGDFDAGQSGFNWMNGGLLVANQTLTLADDLGGSNKTLNIDGGSWDRGDDLLVEGVQTTLQILNGGGVTNVNGFVGSSLLGSSNNTVMVSGAGSHWINQGDLAVGNSASNTANSVNVGAGGLVRADGLSIGVEDAFNLNSGGTLAMADGFNVSLDGFNWEAGGTLSVGGVLEGLATTNEGRILSGKKTLVLDGGTFTTTTNLIVGYESSDNILVLTNGGSVANANGYIGWGAMAGNNSVLVSDADSAWTNSGNLYVGVYGTNLLTSGIGNSLTVSNEAWVFVGGVDTNLTALGSGGVAVASNANMVVGVGADVVTDGLYIDDNGDFDLDGSLTLNGDFDAEQAGFNWNDGGTLTMGGALTLNDDLGGSNKTLNIDAGGSWNPGGLNLDGVQTRLMVMNGGRVDCTTLHLGLSSDATENRVEISGTNSTLNADFISVGNEGSENTLIISNAGHVESFSGIIGVSSNAVNNEAIVDGGMWTISGGSPVSGDLVIGYAGSDNELTIKKGGVVHNVTGYVGRVAGASNNTVLVTGDGSEWNNSSILNIGGAISNNNAVTVEFGGTVSASDLVVVEGNYFNLNNSGTLALSGDYNVLQDEGFNWNSGGHLAVGGELSGMAVETNLLAGDSFYLNGGRDLTLDGGRWINGGNSNLVIGLNGDFSTLVLTNGGTMGSADGYIGWGSLADNNSVRVEAGSAWTNSGNLYVGTWRDANTNQVDAGNNNSLIVKNDGWVFVGEGRTNGPSGGLVVASTNGAELVIGGKGSTVEVEQGLYVGIDSGVTGSVTVANGGSLSVGDLLIATNSTFDLFGSLATESDFNITQAGFSWYDEARLSVGGELTGLDTLEGTNRTIEIAGAGGSWSDFLGVTGVSNTLAITDAGQVYSDSAFIGASTNDFGNTVLVSGTGSVWNVAGDLFVNSSNTLKLASGGLVSVDGTMTVSNATVAGSGTIELNSAASLLSVYGTNSYLSSEVLFDGSGGSVAFTDSELMVDGSLSNRFVNFNRLSMTNSLLGGTGVVDVFANIDLSGGRIAPVGELTLGGGVTADGTVLEINTLADQLRVMGAFDISTMGTAITIPNGLNPALFTNTVLIAEGNVIGEFDADSVEFIEHYFLYDFDFDYGTTNVDVVSEVAVDGEIGSSLAYAGVQGIRAGFNGMQNAAFVRTKQLRRNSVATDHAISHEVYLMSLDDAPSGPQGPGDKNTIFGMHFWAEQFSGQGDYDAMGNSDGFTLNNNGTSFGLDRLLGDSLVVGVNYTYARSAISATEGDKVDTETYWLGLYSEWFSASDYYLEGLFGLGWSDYNTVRTDIGYAGEAAFDGSDLGGHIEAGKYFHSQRWAIAPYAGLNYLWIKSDSYTETERSSGGKLEVDAETIASLESAIGVKLRNRFDTQSGRFQTVAYVEWAYDFLNEEISSTLTENGVSVGTARITPGASLINTGVGLSWICTEYLEVGLGYDGRFNENYEEHMGSIMLDVRF